jgi:hypothetical protein
VEVEVELVGQVQDQLVLQLDDLVVLEAVQLLLTMVDLLVHPLLEEQVILLQLVLLKEIMEVQHFFIHQIELVEVEVVLEL